MTKIDDRLADRFCLQGRTALVTGASRGIGASIALGLGQAGATVAVNYSQSAGPAEKVVASIEQTGAKAVAIQTNLGQSGAAKALYEGCRNTVGEPDILVLNVAVQIPSNWTEITREQFDHQLAVNLRSAMELMQCCAPGMQSRRWGRILTIGSVQEAKPHPQMLVYAALKNAQTAMVRNLARQLAPDNVTVNNLAPGVIETDRNRDRLADAGYRASVLKAIPMRRAGEPVECVGAALLLCSDAGAYITGQSLYVDGGMSL